MDPRTHVIIAKKIYNALDPQKKSIIKKKNFIYGNIFVILVKNLGLFVILYVIFFVYCMMRDGNLNIACLFILLMKKN